MFFALKGPYNVTAPPASAPNQATLTSIRTMPPGGYDVYEDVLYDTETWPQVSLTPQTPLPFFQGQASGDKTITNLPGGQLPSPQMFHGQRLFISPLVTSAVGNVLLTAAGLVPDLDNIFLASRSFFTYYNPPTNKTRGPIPLNLVGSGGGVIPVYGGTQAPGAGAGAVIQSARLSEHGGWPLNLVVFPTEQVQFQLFAGVQTALTTDGIPIRLLVYGWRYMKGG